MTKAAWQAEAEKIFTLARGYITGAAKAMALCLENEIHTLEQMDVRRSVVALDGKVMASSVKAPTVQQITIPATLAGAEFGVISRVTDERTHIK